MRKDAGIYCRKLYNSTAGAKCRNRAPLNKHYLLIHQMLKI